MNRSFHFLFFFHWFWVEPLMPEIVSHCLWVFFEMQIVLRLIFLLKSLKTIVKTKKTIRV